MLIIPLMIATAAAADTPAQCEPSYEGTQLLRQQGKLRDARDHAALCARDVCPQIARGDCARWVDELTREIPTVVVVARDPEGKDIPLQRLLVDGLVRPEVASGRAFELDPGAHTFRVEPTDGAAVQATFTVYQGERDRLLRMTLPAKAWVTGAAPPSAAPFLATTPVPAPAPASADRPSIAPAVVVGVASAVVLATSAYLGLTGRQQLSDLRSSCAPACADSQVGPVRTRLVVSDVTLGVGLVGAALAAYLFAVRGAF